MTAARLCRSLIFAILASGVIGCGQTLVPVNGICKRNGKPISNLSLIFAPTVGKPLWASTDNDGRFELNLDAHHKGIPLGTYTVMVSFQFRSPQDEIDHMAGKFHFHPDKDAIIQKYGATAANPLVVQVTHANQELELNLD